MTARSIPVCVVLLMSLLLSIPAPAQTFTVLHAFTGGSDGGNPYGTLAFDRSGNLYGTTIFGGNHSCHDASGEGCGVVYKLTRHQSSWLYTPLYLFAGGSDGSNPLGGATIAADGTLYGTTDSGGGCGGNSGASIGRGCGTVFRLRPPASRCNSVLCPWTETVVYRFTAAPDGYDPWATVVLDSAANIYGTTNGGGAAGYGTVYKLTPSGSGWTESLIHSFTNTPDGAYPLAPVTIGADGNLYGTSALGGAGSGQCSTGCGTVFELASAGSGWNASVLYNFNGQQDGALPRGGLLFDPAGNLIGTTASGFNAVFQLTPSGGSWLLSTLYGMDFGGLESFYSGMARDAAGNLYGVSNVGGGGSCTYGCGSVFKLTPAAGGWTYTLLHQFTGGEDGANPIGTPIVDAAGNVYGVAGQGALGSAACEIGCGTVWEITP